jgi:orotidine-5'-phosphate decarboxylase
MMRRAVEAARPTRVLAVTVLTSLDARDMAADGQPLSVEELVLRRAELAQQAGCAGVIASPREVAALRKKYDFLIVTPGVRPTAGGDDQKRTATAREARAAGADALVVGRPIRDAQDPLATVRAIVQDLT